MPTRSAPCECTPRKSAATRLSAVTAASSPRMPERSSARAQKAWISACSESGVSMKDARSRARRNRRSSARLNSMRTVSAEVSIFTRCPPITT